MPSTESIQTQLQGSFVKNAEGNYSLQTTGAAGGTSTVALSQTGTDNTVKIAAAQSISATIPTVQAVTAVTANGKVTTPAALAAIATTPNLAAGTWDIEVFSFIGGTTVATTELDNMKFNIGATVVATILNPVPGTTGATSNGIFRIRVNLGGSTPVSVTTGVLATTGAIYSASIIATRIA